MLYVVCLTLMWPYYNVCKFNLLNMESYFDITLQYMRYFTNDKDAGETKYVGGTVTVFPTIDNDYFNIHDMHIMCRKIGVTNIVALHFLVPVLNLDDSLCILQCDKDCWDLFEWLSFALKRCIDMYAEQPEYTPLMVSEAVLLLTNDEVEDGDINVDNVADVVGEGLGGDGFFDDEYADRTDD